MKWIIALLLLVGIIGSVSAVTITSSDISIAAGNTGTSTITLDSAPAGLSGCNVTVSVVNSSVASISGITFDTWAMPHTNSAVPASSVIFTEADFGNVKQSGATNIILAYITLSGVTPGATTLQVNVTACDDDVGTAMSPSVSHGTVTISSSPTPAPTPTHPPSVYFPTTTYAGVHLLSATLVNGSNASLSGMVDSPTTDTTLWFMLGTSSGVYSYYTQPGEVNTSTGILNRTLSGSPLSPGTTYYVRAATVNGSSAEEYSFTTATTTLPTSNYSSYFNNMQYSNHSPLFMLSMVPLPLVDLFGAGSSAFGWNIFFTLVFGLIFIVLVVRQDSIVMVFIGGALAASIILTLMLQEFMWLIFAVMVMAVAGIGYRLMRRE